jgi:type I site-specific restriction-modification system R (restriction) subunit
VQARIGTLGAGKEWFKPWRTITGRGDAASLTELQVILEGVFEKRRFLDLLRHFIVFEDMGGEKLAKKMAGYHQFHAVNVAVEETLRAARTYKAAEPPGRYEAGRKPGGDPGDRRVGVVWHTQGSGKSLTMACTRQWKIRLSWFSPTATTSMTSSSEHSPDAVICFASRRCKPPTEPICAQSSRSPPAA